MRLIPSDPDIETIVGRIDDGSLDLQPEFQRGAVWTRPKQRLLIDSILRGWYVPPVHVVRNPDESQVVLDGQQRLNSIYEFVQGAFPVEGRADPAAAAIIDLDGLYYDRLPETVRRRFDRFTIRMFEVVDYSAEEPFELFYRLNQPTLLTSAEKRNAFFGPARAQVRELTEWAQEAGMTPERVGFSNARLAYEDVVARFVWTLEVGRLDERVSATRVTERYRSDAAFEPAIIDLAKAALTRLFSVEALDRHDLRLNKAMLHTWLLFVARATAEGTQLDAFDGFVPDVEGGRLALKGRTGSELQADTGSSAVMYAVLNDRATSRVNDVSSVLLRDAMLWALYALWHGCSLSPPVLLARVLSNVASQREAEERALEVVADTGWGSLT